MKITENISTELLPQYEQFISNFNNIRDKRNIVRNINNTLLEIKDQIEIIKNSLDNITISQHGGQIKKKIVKSTTKKSLKKSLIKK